MKKRKLALIAGSSYLVIFFADIATGQTKVRRN
jgi:hypothetical protein